ncbi:VOC family protein [Brevibacillus laterosporus]|uniref:VOC family protein n=1 Tax=Brevibacillus laterosporus TaxID=1465 RepID=UPI0014448687|nr:VOC family protein [Brevibacillus laterosporus]MBG9796570.1 glyoxalase [Brevibacillus laterosporus]MED1912537.1 VOC family protein [Brevibacillus laterosporus]NKQ21737.1 VOC family protein [Brevibacillus laterosporus]WNX30544.1 VOC family protein [Brevibacillus laterosporus]
MNFHGYPYTFVSQVHLIIENIERSIAFYKDMLGLQILDRTETKVVFTANGKTPLVTIEQPDNVAPKEPWKTGLYHFALLVPSRADLANTLLHLLQEGYPLQGASDHLVSEAVYLADPDGNGIEIYVDRPSETWVWEGDSVGMSTEPLDIEGLLQENKEENWKGLPSGTIMGHIHLQVANLQQAEEFYTQGLGFEVVSRYGSQALFISTGKYHHHIGLNTWVSAGASAPSPNSVGLQSYTLVLPDEESRERMVQQVKSFGASIKEENGIMITKDPFGNTIRLVV